MWVVNTNYANELFDELKTVNLLNPEKFLFLVHILYCVIKHIGFA